MNRKKIVDNKITMLRRNNQRSNTKYDSTPDPNMPDEKHKKKTMSQELFALLQRINKKQITIFSRLNAPNVYFKLGFMDEMFL